MPLQPKPIQCVLCNNANDFLFIKDYQSSSQNFSLYQCQNCAVQFWTPLKNPGGDWYVKENAYSLRAFDNYRMNRGYQKLFLKRWVNKFKGQKMLDLGCGTGALLSMAQKQGVDVWGVDFDADGVKVAKEKFNLQNIFLSSFEDFFACQDLPQFDVIISFEVLMHLDNPQFFLEQATKLLKPSATMIFSVPSRERMWATSNRWDLPPHHFTLWNRQAIESLGQLFGLSVNFLTYIEQYKILRESAVDRFRFGLVGKVLQKSDSQSLQPAYSKLAKILYYLGKIKEHVLGTIPAAVGWVFGKITGKHNGIIYVELIKHG